MHQKHLWPRVCAAALSNIVIGFVLAWLLRIRLGSDPCTTMSSGISSHLPISFGTWNLVFNGVLLLIVLICNRRLLGPGTIFNMVLCGYSADFFGWLIDLFIPEAVFASWPARILICIPTLAVFILAAALYMSVDMGTSPYDAIPFLIANSQSKFSFRAVRTAWDVLMLVIGLAAGAAFGPVTIITAFTLGTVISWVSRQIHQRFLV